MTIEEEARILAQVAAGLPSGGYTAFGVSEDLEEQILQIIDRTKKILLEEREDGIEFNHSGRLIEVERA
ncbi:hypothetical protein BN2905_34660 [Achromobacter xylosoxidans]|uniref:hypothetical protein n=1 Tax=Alcaligenes xylosoxydans xylosoxydans TaxID=85698 RepID=UPI0012A996F3|nr:hypothetical protein [Achromobacter xylosoxidans]CUR74465.1 hypothetical protein BN2905_34660 [Achromobacter xylosoxidans]